MKKIFQKLKFNFEKSIFFQFEPTNVQVKIKFSLKNSKICSYMHLFKKWSKYAFAYESMQMHNYPKPIDHNKRLPVFLLS